ncbi:MULTISPECIES: sigma 54-interacting transcriptional regulator [Acutalibacteraceae]|uniref:sigma 54-interacting transcriptional regulator n=1 Tax=Acutalibacteraceae TaxID=3082771 RepID=UPI0013E8A3A6|nr:MULTISPECIES: sigma 54-interacting transcriptional regulator [Acutalibacteraceae]
MAKVMFVSPHMDIQDLAMKVASQERLQHCQPILFRVVDGREVQSVAEEAKSEHVDVIIARGQQARLIKQMVEIPLVELLLTGQEMGVMVDAAKKMVQMENPSIAVVGQSNMYSDMQEFDRLFHVQLRQYFVEDSNYIEEAARQALQDGSDVILGGDIACQYAQKHGVPSMFVNSGRESIANALRQAELVALTSDRERENTAQMRALLDYSFNGIIWLDPAGRVVSMNHVAESMLDLRPGIAAGRMVDRLIPELDMEIFNEVLQKGKDIFARVMQLHERTFLVNFAPILVGEQVGGVILSLQESVALSRMESNIRQAIYRQGFVAAFHFSAFEYVHSTAMKQVLSAAKICAKSDAPLLITGPEGTEKMQLAQAVHNESRRRDHSFVTFHCGCVEPGQCSLALFGRGGQDEASHGMFESANDGTLLLEDVEHLSMDAQRRLLHYLQTGTSIPCGAYSPQRLNVRIIAMTGCDLGLRMEQGAFSASLFYAIDVFSLKVPPLQERKEDLDPLIDRTINELEHRYSRYLSLTKDAKHELMEYDWPGNLPQLRAFCERLLLMSPHRSVNGDYVRHLLMEAYPVVLNFPVPAKQELDSPEAALLARLIAKYGGDRERIARELGISKTTLWRRIKKLGVGKVDKNVGLLEPDDIPQGPGKG